VSPTAAVVGVDVGGTKIAAGVVDLADGRVAGRRQVPTAPERGPEAVLRTLVELVEELAAATGDVAAVGIGVCELVDPRGRVRSGQTIDWRGVDLPAAVRHVAPARVESDVRAAAHAEARFGAGRGAGDFLYVSVGTGISLCAVLSGRPYPGTRGNAIILGAPAVEDVASGSALAAAAGRARAQDVLADPGASALVARAAAALGTAIAGVVNALDPALVVIGGGLGLAEGYRAAVEDALRAGVWAEETAALPVVPAQLGADAGIVGAALAAVS